MKDKTTLGKFIQMKRKENSLSQRELAEKLYVTESAISKWERGVSYPDITMISGICEALKITEHELCTASEDHKQHEIEKMAQKYTRFIKIYTIIFALGYMSAIIPCFIEFVIKNHRPSQFFILITSLMLTSSLLNVPVLVTKNKGLITLGSFYVSLNLLLLSGCVYSGGKWFLMAFLSVLFSMCIIFLPIILRHTRLGVYVGRNKGLICLAADSILLLLMVLQGTLRDGSNLRENLVISLFFVSAAWAVFAVIRYAKMNALFKTSASIAIVGFYTYFGNSILAVLIDGDKFKLISDVRGNNIIALWIVAFAVAFAVCGGVYKYLRKDRNVVGK